MNISILTAFPKLYTAFLETSLIGRAQERGIISCDVVSFLSYCQPKERIDAPAYGHGAGMLIKPIVVERAIEDQDKKHGKAFKIFFSPQGKKLDQRLLVSLAECLKNYEHLMLVTARYEGMDARVEEQYADEIISVGDLVLMGGDIPAMMLLEGLLRYIPQVVGKEESVIKDSFTGPFVDYPSFTEPVEWKGREVPQVIRSGDHKAMDTWRQEQAVHKSVVHHFEWVRSSTMTKQEQALVNRYIPDHYVALLHSEVLVKGQEGPGDTSVTSIDIHDIARSAATYGLKEYFIVTGLLDQQKIVQRLLGFWQEGPGYSYNPSRFEAVKNVTLVADLDSVIAQIEQKTGKKPLLIGTSAREVPYAQAINFYDQEKVWALDRPVLFLLGTGQGIADTVLQRCDFMLNPIKGFTDFNHLSVRSAAAILFDRWLGWNTKH